jgi:hypothetical protein
MERTPPLAAGPSNAAERSPAASQERSNKLIAPNVTTYNSGKGRKGKASEMPRGRNHWCNSRNHSPPTAASEELLLQILN